MQCKGTWSSCQRHPADKHILWPSNVKKWIPLQNLAKTKNMLVFFLTIFNFHTYGILCTIFFFLVCFSFVLFFLCLKLCIALLIFFLDAEGVCGQRAAAAQRPALLREEEIPDWSPTNGLTSSLWRLRVELETPVGRRATSQSLNSPQLSLDCQKKRKEAAR